MLNCGDYQAGSAPYEAVSSHLSVDKSVMYLFIG